MPELFFSCPAALEEVLAGICACAGVSRADKDTLLNWETPGDADETTLSALKRALDAQSGPASHNLRSFLRLHAFTPVLRSRRRECGVALERKEARRDELRARQQHRDYNGLVADLRKSEIEQVGLQYSSERDNAIPVGTNPSNRATTNLPCSGRLTHSAHISNSSRLDLVSFSHLSLPSRWATTSHAVSGTAMPRCGRARLALALFCC